VEKCERLWRQEHQTGDRHEVQGAVYSINGAGQANEMRACSACAGDYEDPECTAWSADEKGEADGDGEWDSETESFLAEE
jgi:hypothetical protein